MKEPDVVDPKEWARARAELLAAEKAATRADMSAKEVVKQAAAAGIKINEASVYGARSAAKKKGAPCL